MDRGKQFSQLVAIELSAEGKRRKITQKQIAAAMGVGETQMSLYTKGKRGDVTVVHLLRAAERLGISPDVIVERAYEVLLAKAAQESSDELEVDVQFTPTRPVAAPPTKQPARESRP